MAKQRGKESLGVLSAVRRALSRRRLAGERGIVLVESLAALAIVGTVVLAALGGLSVYAIATRSIDAGNTAMQLARSRLETVKDWSYSSTDSVACAAAAPPNADFGVLVTVSTSPPIPNGLKLVTVSVYRSPDCTGAALLSVEMYKANLL